MSKSSYIIKFTDSDEYEHHKDRLIASSEYHVKTTKRYIWVLHNLTIEEYKKIKSYGIHITLDSTTFRTCGLLQTTSL